MSEHDKNNDTIVAKPAPRRKFNTREFFQKYTMVFALAIVTLVFALWPGKQGVTINPGNITGLLTENVYVFVLAAGMLLCILTGGNIDLSVGSVICFSAAIGCTMMQNGINMWIAVIYMLLIGLAIGVFQGFWIAKVRIPAFIATLAGMYAFRGFANMILQGKTVRVEDTTYLTLFSTDKIAYIPDFVKNNLFPGLKDVFTKDNAFFSSLLGQYVTKFNVTCMLIGILCTIGFIFFKVHQIRRQKKLGIQQSIPAQIVSTIVISAVVLWLCFQLSCSRGFPIVLIWVAMVLAIYMYITTKTAIGRHLYAVGGNEKATALSGIKTRNVYWFAYANMGLLAGLAGVLVAGRLKGIDPTIGVGYEMDAIGACFIGGASAYGGTGTISGTIIGVLLMGMITKGLTIVGVGANYRVVAKGVVLLLAVMFDVLIKRQKT